MNTHFLRTTALTCAMLALSMTAAQANDKSVRLAQERLAIMGYYAGSADGKLGELTKDAIRDFQAQNGLAVTGALSNETYSLLKDQAVNGYRGYYGAQYSYGYGYNGYRANGYNGYYAPYQTTAARWNGYNYAPVAAYNYGYLNTVRSTVVPIRYGQLAIHNDVQMGTNNYSVMLNGQPILQANNQPQALKVSNTYRLNGEDAIIFTAYDGSGSCSYKNYLLTVRADGTYTAPQEVGNCSGNYQARVDNGQLFISFAGEGYGRYASLDSWRYGYGSLGRM